MTICHILVCGKYFVCQQVLLKKITKMTKGKHKSDKAAEHKVNSDESLNVEENLPFEKEGEMPVDVVDGSLEQAEEVNSEEVDALNAKIAELKDKYIRLTAEYDNYRKRTQREREELLKTAGESTIKDILTIVDDFERGMQALQNLNDSEGYEGVKLIYDKFMHFLKSKGVEVINPIGEDFNTDFEEAITKFPAPNPEMKGKVIDVVQKGYLMNGKVIRYAKVVVGE